MHINRLVLTIAVIFVLSSLFGNIIHALLLHSDYASLPGLYRSAVDVDMRLILFGYLAFSVGAVWLYSHGVEDLPWFGQGIRFGIAMWLVISLPMYLWAFATQPLPETLLWKQLGYEFVSYVILGMVMALMVRKA